MILVTGGAGFIGSVLAQTLNKIDRKIRVFDVISPGGDSNGIEFMRGDIRDSQAIEVALNDVDTVYHCVALVPLAKAGEDFWDVNVLGTKKLLNACRKKNISYFAHVSSSAVFGTPKCPISDQTPRLPVEIYGRAKLAGEEAVRQYITEGRNGCIIRPRTVIGNYRLGIFDILFEWISENRAIPLIGKGGNLFQFIHVDDLVSAMILAAEKKISGEFNIGTDRFGTLRDDLEAFIWAVGSTSVIRALPIMPSIFLLSFLDYTGLSPLAPWHYRTYHKPFYFDIQGSVDALSWSPRYSNIEMLISSYEWHMRNAQEFIAGGQSTHHSRPKQRVLKILKWIS